MTLQLHKELRKRATTQNRNDPTSKWRLKKSTSKKMPLDVQSEYEDRLDEVPHIFSKMQPMIGAVEAFEELSMLYDTYILSTAPWENSTAWSDKLGWVKLHLGKSAHKRLILSHHKNLNHGDFLVDDRTKNGADKFQGMHIHFGTPLFPDWITVTRFLKTKV